MMEEKEKKNPFGYVFTTSVDLPNGGRMVVEGIITEQEMKFSRDPKVITMMTLAAQGNKILENLELLGVFNSCFDSQSSVKE